MSCRTGAWMPSEPLAPGSGRGDEGRPVVAVDEADARDDDEEHDEELDSDEHEVDPHRLLDALGDEQRQRGDEEEGRQVEVPPLCRSQRLGPGDAELSEQGDEVGRPPLCHNAGPEHELEQQVPSDGPCDDLAEGGVGEGVGRSGHRHGRGELRVAEGGQTTHHGADDEGVDDRRPGILLGRSAGDREDAGADDDADAEDDEIERRQTSFEMVVGLISGRQGLLDRLRAKETHADLRAGWVEWSDPN